MDPHLLLTIYLCVWLAAAGAVLGSFLGCAVWRWARGEAMFRGRSHCAGCGRTLSPGELVPVFSYLFSRGRCRGCGGKIPAECLWAELAGGLAFVCLGIRFGLTLELAQWLVFGGLLLAVSLTDGAKRIIPDKLLIAMAVNRVVWLFALGQPLWDTVKGMLASGIIPAALLAFVLLAEKVLGREAMGGGDIKLLLAMAFYLSWPELLLTLLGGCLLGIIGAAAARKTGAIPFGPYLAAAGVLAVCFGGPLVSWYLGLF